MVVAPSRQESAKTRVLLEQFDEEIKSAEYRKAAETYCRLIVEHDMSAADAMHAAVRTAAPFVQVPSHEMATASGQIRGVNYDHTILGWRGAIRLAPEMTPERAVLPMLQSMWYVPQGLNVWEQILCEFPGHYARQEGCALRYPSEDGEDRFDGPAWTPPKLHFDEHEPITNGSVDDRLERLNWAISSGDRAESYGLFLGLADDPANRERLKERVLFAGIIDLQDTLINQAKGYANIGHKALRARAMVDIADYLGWERSHELIYSVVPDLGCSPRLFGLWNEINTVVKVELAGRQVPKRGESPMSEVELDRLRDALLWGGAYEVNDAITALYRRGYGILDVADGLAVSYQRYLLDVLDHPSSFNYPMHSFDYLNVITTWIRRYDNPHQYKTMYLAARFMNDAIRYNAMVPRDPKFNLEPRTTYRPYADELPLDRLLPALEEAILAQDAPRSGALVDSYLERTDERKRLMESITYAACHFQNDPHIMRNCASSLEEWSNNRTSRRDDIIRGWVKHQSRYIKRADVLDCLALYKQYFTPGTN
jgi:hypothetical protein